jgi:hypothetical protein
VKNLRPASRKSWRVDFRVIENKRCGTDEKSSPQRLFDYQESSEKVWNARDSLDARCILRLAWYLMKGSGWSDQKRFRLDLQNIEEYSIKYVGFHKNFSYQ